MIKHIEQLILAYLLTAPRHIQEVVVLLAAYHFHEGQIKTALYYLKQEHYITKKEFRRYTIRLTRKGLREIVEAIRSGSFQYDINFPDNLNSEDANAILSARHFLTTTVDQDGNQLQPYAPYAWSTNGHREVVWRAAVLEAPTLLELADSQEPRFEEGLSERADLW